MASDTAKLFSVNSDRYAAARPRYPRELFEFLSSHSPALDRVWDCGTGSGQAAVALAEWFAQVEATDVSPQQLANAHRHARVHYTLLAAERTVFPDAHFSLVTVAQALHWFDLNRFWPEVHRVLKPGGVFAAWTYTMPFVSAALDRIVTEKLSKVVERYWSPGNKIAWDGYRGIPFPFEEVQVPPLQMVLHWNLEQFIAYLETWSATRLCIDANGREFFDSFARELTDAWGDPAEAHAVEMGFFCRVGRLPGVASTP